MPRLFLELFSSVSVEDFQNVVRLQRVITLRHSVGFQCNLVHEQTTLSPASCSQKIYDLFLRFCTVLAFLENGIFQITRRVLGCKSGEFGFVYLIKHRIYQAMHYFKAWLRYRSIQYFTVINR